MSRTRGYLLNHYQWHGYVTRRNKEARVIQQFGDACSKKCWFSSLLSIDVVNVKRGGVSGGEKRYLAEVNGAFIYMKSAVNFKKRFELYCC